MEAKKLRAELSFPESQLLGSYSGKLAVDLGTNLGGSAYILSQLHDKVITIDVFEKTNMIENDSNRLHYSDHIKKWPRTYSDVKENIALITDKIEVRQGLTYRGHDDVTEIDTLFIDADHSYDGAKKDFEYWFPKVRGGGVVMFHDSIKRDFHTVYRLIEELLERDDIYLMGYIDSLTVWKKLNKKELINGN